MSECIEWQGTIASHGYGVRKIKGKTHYAHRLAYAEVNGPIPDGALILHSCDNRRCVNVEHLRAGSYADNVHDMYERDRQRYAPHNASKVECVHGHPLSGDNLYVQPSTGKRYCRSCARERKARFARRP